MLFEQYKKRLTRINFSCRPYKIIFNEFNERLSYKLYLQRFIPKNEKWRPLINPNIRLNLIYKKHVKSELCENKAFVQMRLLRKWEVEEVCQCYGNSDN